MKRFFQFCMAVITIATLLFQSPTWALEPTVANPEKLYQPMLLDLQMTGIPLKLPTYIPALAKVRNENPTDNAATLKLPVYAHLDEFTPNGYSITIGYTETCDGGNVCRLGSIAAQRLTKGTPPIDEQYAFMKPNAGFKGKRSQEPMQPVQLAENIQGLFVPWICGSACNDAKVIWDQGSYRYIVGLKVGDRDALVAMANSAITQKFSNL